MLGEIPTIFICLLVYFSPSQPPPLVFF